MISRSKAEIAWEVNVEGTRQVIEFVRNHPSIERYMYFSTAYVAGKREGMLLETELIRPNAFKNHYEETKFEAELLVEELKERCSRDNYSPWNCTWSFQNRRNH